MKICWVFDVISPFSYLGLKQLPKLPSTVNVDFVPVLFARLLDHFGQLGNAEIESKRRFTYRFVLWRARKLGIPMRMPPSHPFNPLNALRLIVAAGSNKRAVETVFDAVFLHGLDVADAQVLMTLAHQLGVSDSQTTCSTQSVKRRLRENTEWAIKRGIFGVPTFVVGDELFWGHDAFEMLLDYLRNPELFQDPQFQAAEQIPVGVERLRRAPR